MTAMGRDLPAFGKPTAPTQEASGHNDATKKPVESISSFASTLRTGQLEHFIALKNRQKFFFYIIVRSNESLVH